MGDPLTNRLLKDQRHLSAAEGWIELGLHLEAAVELEQITPQQQGHPDVLELRWHICAKEKQWLACVELATIIIQLAPERVDGWIHRSFALHELRRTQEAFTQLLPVVSRFPSVWTLPYNLACYAAQLHQFAEAQKWLEQALVLDKKKVQQAARDDDDLKPLWDDLGGVMWEQE